MDWTTIRDIAVIGGVMLVFAVPIYTAMLADEERRLARMRREGHDKEDAQNAQDEESAGHVVEGPEARHHVSP